MLLRFPVDSGFIASKDFRASASFGKCIVTLLPVEVRAIPCGYLSLLEKVVEEVSCISVEHGLRVDAYCAVVAVRSLTPTEFLHVIKRHKGMLSCEM